MNKAVKIIGGILGAVGLGVLVYKAFSSTGVAKGMPVMDANGNVIGTTRPDGTVVNAAGQIVGAISDAGKVFDAANNIIGQVVGKGGQPATGGTEEVVTPAESNAILYIGRKDAANPNVTEVRVGNGSTGVFNPGDMVRVDHPDLKGDFMVTEFDDAVNPVGGWVRIDVPFSRIKSQLFPGWPNPIAPSNWDPAAKNVKPVGTISLIGESDGTLSASGARKKPRSIFRTEAAARKILQQQGKKKGLTGKALRQYIRMNAKAEAMKHKTTPSISPRPRPTTPNVPVRPSAPKTASAPVKRSADGWQS